MQRTTKYSRCCLFRYEIKLYLPEELTSGATCTLPEPESSIYSDRKKVRGKGPTFT